ncbi:MAG TPA: orotate phosphoribosyltransferase [Candidatus Onthomorpha intestinigallinarum]|uniref:Orotate phosphoribosyltransferase n=1 Tax=Candidatus Onthomorpha intestinigallinarum TaxID=2840880 RepID=A0A9D1RJA8_9BACT|nr:orotate phosphoribosyltransferase [Candidatus Onthomorpha intestinigallinarum]
MITNKETAVQAARFLLQIKAIKLNNENPFTWASGRKSPIYCDNRVTLSHPEIRTYIRQRFVSIINDICADVDVIAGVATGGIAHGVLVAQDLGKPFVYVRPEEKKHGLNNKIEGEVKSGQSVFVIEDLISTGKSSLQVVESLREHGCIVKGMAAIFTYNLEVAKQAFEQANVQLETITDYHTLIDVAAEENFIKTKDLESLTEWRKNPEAWSEMQLNK